MPLVCGRGLCRPIALYSTVVGGIVTNFVMLRQRGVSIGLGRLVSGEACMYILTPGFLNVSHMQRKPCRLAGALKSALNNSCSFKVITPLSTTDTKDLPRSGNDIDDGVCR